MFQYIFKLDFVCPCDLRYNIPFCLLYVVLPFSFVTLTVMLIDPHCTWECKLNECRIWAHCSFNSQKSTPRLGVGNYCID
uniref:Uncharacterized protein n=1 Tax=Anguilla anguilla TaxID=7936 RepID=A0A0E9UKY9_ANGAN